MGKMKYLLICFYFGLLSCHVNVKEPHKLIEITVFHEECTECLDATIIAPFEYPDSIKNKLINPKVLDILLDGENPYESEGLLGGNNLKKRFKLSGYFSKVDSTNNPFGNVAVFYVVNSKNLE
jgi:hypothetical protein